VWPDESTKALNGLLLLTTSSISLDMESVLKRVGLAANPLERHWRNKALRVLGYVSLVHGEEAAYGMLSFYSATGLYGERKKGFVRGEMGVFSLMKQLGVKVVQKERTFTITDVAGTFKYTDDYYYSCTRHLFKKQFELYGEDVCIYDSIRAFHSVDTHKVKNNCGHMTPIAYLDYLHETGKYPDGLVAKLWGGDFSKTARKVQFLNKTPKVYKAVTVLTKQDGNKNNLEEMQQLGLDILNAVSKDDRNVASAVKLVRRLLCGVVNDKVRVALVPLCERAEANTLWRRSKKSPLENIVGELFEIGKTTGYLFAFVFRCIENFKSTFKERKK